MKCTCTHCGEFVNQDRNLEGHNYCTTCGNIFLVPSEPKVRTWVWGVVVFLMTNWQVLRNL